MKTFKKGDTVVTIEGEEALVERNLIGLGYLLQAEAPVEEVSSEPKKRGPKPKKAE